MSTAIPSAPSILTAAPLQIPPTVSLTVCHSQPVVSATAPVFISQPTSKPTASPPVASLPCLGATSITSAPPQTPPRPIPALSPAHASPILQSQARALPAHLLPYAPVFNTVSTPPIAMRTRRRKAIQLDMPHSRQSAPWSPYLSPSQRQGARRKQRAPAKSQCKATRTQHKTPPTSQSSAKSSLVSTRSNGKANLTSVIPPASQSSGKTGLPVFPQNCSPTVPSCIRSLQRKSKLRSKPYDLAASRR